MFTQSIENVTITGVLRRQISLLCILMQSIGIRFFGGLSLLLLIIVFVLNFKNLIKLNTVAKPLPLILTTGYILLLCLFKGFSILALCYLLGVILIAVLTLLNYNNSSADFISDITPLLWFFAIYGFISWSLLILIPGIFENVSHGLRYSTFHYILINASKKSADLPRLSSLFWEPGCAQFVLNFLLLILVTKKEKLSKILFVAFLVIATKSTTGYINLIFITLLYAILNKKHIIPLSIAGLAIFSFGIYTMMSSNIADKLENSSGIIRTRDMYVGYNLAKSHPLLGVDTENLGTNREAQALEDKVWGGSSVWTDYQGYFAGGYTNGLFGVLLDYGLIMGLLLYWFTVKAPVIWNNRRQIHPYIFFCIYFCSLIGEPISRTSLFFFFAFSYLVNHGRQCKLKHSMRFSDKLKAATS